MHFTCDNQNTTLKKKYIDIIGFLIHCFKKGKKFVFEKIFPKDINKILRPVIIDKKL